MLPTRRERKKEKSRNDLIDCAVSLFREKGFAETSIDEITEKADISKGTLYNYFQDKESILVGYFQNKIAESNLEFRARLMGTGEIRSKLNTLLDLMAQILVDDLDLASIYFRYRLRDFGTSFDNSQRSGMENVIVELIKTAQENHEIRTDLPPALIAKNFLFLFMSFFIFDSMKTEPAESRLDREQIIELFLHGAGAQ
jgi:AcrR family transcriptional regulator